MDPEATEIKPGEITPAPNAAPAPVDKPADKPAEPPKDFEAFKAQHRGATAPAPKPAEKPEEKPADKPAEKPEEKPAEKPEGDKPKNKVSAAERIQQLVAKNGETERQAAERIAEANRERDELRARVESLEKGEKPPAQTDGEPKEPDPNDDKYVYGEVDSQYVSDLAEFKARKIVLEERTRVQAERDQQTALAQAAEAEEQLADFLETGTAKHADFADVVYKGGMDGKYALGDSVYEMIQSSDVGHDVIYHLAKNPAEAEKIHKMGPAAQARAFMLLESKFTASSPSPKPGEKPTPKTPAAEPPPRKGEQARGAQGHFTDVPKDFEAFKAKVRAENNPRR